MLLRRSLFVLDIIVLIAIVVFLVFLPAERCAHFEARQTPPDSKCNLHPVHHPEFSFTQNLPHNDHLSHHEHHVSVCHLLRWSHYNFFENMYLILLPAVACLCLIAYTVCEIFEFDLFVGQVFISHEHNRIQNNWPFLQHIETFGASDSPVHVSVPTTWQYSIAMCILSALFKIGRILIQHFIGDKKFTLDEDDSDQKEQRNTSTENLLNESRYSRLATD